ncbi:MAG: ParB/RepB/Spo0J family partition protein [Clostridia bacterium]|nr:ParB/RepB/Spo0J family partition protein [Clostridia bacterium]
MSEKKKGLGRGLQSLFADTAVNEEMPVNPQSTEEVAFEVSPDSVSYINLNNIKPNASQPRKTFDPESIKDLADSIREHGMIQPIIVRPSENGFEIVAGERRWRAAREAGLKSVPALIRELNDRENMLIALIENMQREDLNPIEEAFAFREMMTRYGLTQDEVSKSVGKSRPYISNSMRLLKLPEIVRKMVAEGRLSGGHAKMIAGVESEEMQIRLAEISCDGQMSVRALEAMIANAQTPDEPKKNKKKAKDPELKSIESDLKEIFGTKVNVSTKNGKKGKIEISFYSHDDFDRILGFLKQIQN